MDLFLFRLCSTYWFILHVHNLSFLVIVLSYSSKAFHWLLRSPDVRFFAFRRAHPRVDEKLCILRFDVLGKDAFSLILSMLSLSKLSWFAQCTQRIASAQASAFWRWRPIEFCKSEFRCFKFKMTRKGPHLEQDLVLFNSLDVGNPGEWELQWKPKWKHRKQKPCGRNSWSTPPSWSGDSIGY